MRPYLILVLLLLLKGIAWGQGTVLTTASATIVTPVGAENSGYIDFGHFTSGNTKGTIVVGSNGVRTSSGGISLSANENGAISSINIIGGSFVYDVTVQNEPVTIEANKGECNMKVILFKMPVINNDAGDITYPIGASITVNAFQTPGQKSKLPFNVTVNFN
jgi:hypothetical protein